ADISGIIPHFCHEVQKALNKSGSTGDFMSKLIVMTDEWVEKPTELPSAIVGRKFRFVSSQLVLNQIPRLAEEYVISAAKARFPVSLKDDSMVSEFLNMSSSFLKFRENLQKNHIVDLANLVDPKGKVHFAETSMLIKHMPFGGKPIKK